MIDTDIYRILRIRFKNHYLFNNLEFDFTRKGKPVDTIIIAGDNGSGKTTLLAEIENILGFRKISLETELEVLKSDGNIITINKDSFFGGTGALHVDYGQDNNYKYGSSGNNELVASFSKDSYIQDILGNTIPKTLNDKDMQEKIGGVTYDMMMFNALFSLYSTESLEYYEAYYRISSQKNFKSKLLYLESFINNMFNTANNRLVYLNNKFLWCNDKGQSFSLNDLSSGEKQIIYYGATILNKINIEKTKFVLIDEPENSLHPNWQKRIVRYFTELFSNDGKQSIQFFISTHSPFIINSEYRYNDKVIVLSKNKKSEISILDKPSYYISNKTDVVFDAFNIDDFIDKNSPTLFVEGKTDKLYLDDVCKTFGFKPEIEIEAVGGDDNNCPGKDGLNKLYSFKNKLRYKAIFLFDNDSNKNNDTDCIWVLKKYESSKEIKVGIENSLILNNVDISKFYSTKEKKGNYGETNIINEFEKTKFCNFICSLSIEEKKQIYQNLRKELEDMFKTFGVKYD